MARGGLGLKPGARNTTQTPAMGNVGPASEARAADPQVSLGRKPGSREQLGLQPSGDMDILTARISACP